MNGKVERLQRTVLDAFWAGIDLEQFQLGELNEELDCWIDHYHWDRVHGSLGKPPMYKLLDIWEQMPYWEGADLSFNPRLEAYRNMRFYMEKVLRDNLAEAAADEIEEALRRIERQQRAQERSSGAQRT